MTAMHLLGGIAVGIALAMVFKLRPAEAIWVGIALGVASWLLREAWR